MEKVTVNAELLFILENKRQWINRVPGILPEKIRHAEIWIWVDKNGDVFEIGEDFKVARELKFRAWDKSQKYMAYQGNHDLETLSSFMFHFGNNIVMQSTGIKDYSDNEIYEGDILAFNSSENSRYLVKFDEGEFCLYSKNGRWGAISKMRPTCDKMKIKINVIGNIYENPELWNE